MIRCLPSKIIQKRFRYATALQWPHNAKEKISQSCAAIEKHWKPLLDAEAKQFWSKKRPNGHKYILSMFPYPSGNLHLGHMRVYTISDVTARYYMLNGYNVVHPIGWDSFGLPAENAARERGVDPREWTRSNITMMKEQFSHTGIQFDWSKEISTCEPDFYRWTQWIFLELYKHGLVKRTLAEVNWDPVDGTVLAAEQIDNEGRSWRSGALAEKRKLRQWMVETPKYAKRLSDGLRKVEQWYEVPDIQSHWIGTCDAYRFQFPLRKDNETTEEILDLRVLEPLLIGTAWFVVLKQGHPQSDPKMNNQKEPYLLSSTVLNGVTGEWMPIIVVPEDYEGPQMFLNSRVGDPIADASLISKFNLKPTKKVMPMNFNDIQEIASFGGYGGYLTSRTLQDWVVSRQRAWGTPIPMILSEDGRNYAPMDNNQLPFLQGQGRVKINCDKLPQGYGYCDTDTLDTFVDSSWYYLRFLDPRNSNSLISKEAAKQMPVDIYVGGIEHAAVHMFFARFISAFLTDIGVTSVEEPFRHLIPQGIVRGKTYIEKSTGKYIRNEDVVFANDSAKTKDGQELDVVFEKMSKSKHNGVDPLTVLSRDGIDLTRLQILEAGAPRLAINWGESDMKGLLKWLDRVGWIVNTFVQQRSGGVKIELDDKLEENLEEQYDYYVRNIGMCLEVLNLHNTALQKLIGFTNVLRKTDPVVLATSPAAERCIIALITMMQVYVPHLSNEIWAALQNFIPYYNNISLSNVSWPQVSENCKIDFTFYLDDISLGRCSVPRKQIEDLGLNELVARSISHEHKAIIDRLKSKGCTIENIRMKKRPGFHVTLAGDLVGAESSIIGKTLDEIAAETNKKAKKEKKKKVSKA